MKRRCYDRHLIFVVSAVFLAYLLLLPTFVRRLDPLTGDEPFYVMTAISMVRDFDLDESNNYANRDYDEFYPPDPLPADWRGWPAFPRDLPPHPAVTDRPGLYTKHGLGLSLLIALPYAVFGRVGAMLVVMACATALAAQMYLLGRDVGASPRLAAVLTLALSLTMPLAPYALLLFPEVPAALLLLYAVRRLAAHANAPWHMLAAGVAIGFLPWLHQRFGLTAAVLGIVLVVCWRAAWPSWPFLGAIGAVIAGGVSIVAYNFWLYGQPLQNTRDHAGFSGLHGTVNGLFGVMIDAQWGLFIAAPLLVLSISALPWWYQHARRLALISAAAIVPYLALVAAYKVWWGEWGPPARYMTPIVPFAIAPLAAWLRSVAPGWRVLAAALWLPGATLTLIGLRNPQRLYHHPDGVNNLVSRLGDWVGIDLAGRLVAFQPYAQSPRHEREAAAYLLLAVIVLGYLCIRVVPELLTSLRRGPAADTPNEARARRR